MGRVLFSVILRTYVCESGGLVVLTSNTDFLIKRVLDECGYLVPGPIDLEDICGTFNIAIKRYKGHTSAYRVKDGKKVIYVPKTSDYFGARREIAHELGHYLKHDGIQTELTEEHSSFADFLENQADNFADRLLIPTHLLAQVNLPDDFNSSVKVVSEIFETDEDVAERRLNQYFMHILSHEGNEKLQEVLNKRFLFTYLGYYWRHDPQDANIVYLYFRGKGFIRRLYIEGCYS